MTDGPLLVLQEGSDVHRLHAQAIVIGRSQSCNLRFDRKGVSRRHCEIVLRPNGVIVRDLGSTHGTYVNGSRVAGEAVVQRGDSVRLGSRGPRIRVVDARIGGMSVPLTGARAGATASKSDGSGRGTQIVAQPSHGAQGRATSQPPAGQAPEPKRAFGTGLFVGLLLGAGAGLAALSLLDVGPWIDRAREACAGLI